MTERTAVDFVEEWQTGAFLLLASALAGFVAASAVGRGLSGDLGLLTFAGSSALVFLTFAGSSALVFLALSYLLYGR